MQEDRSEPQPQESCESKDCTSYPDHKEGPTTAPISDELKGYGHRCERCRQPGAMPYRLCKCCKAEGALHQSLAMEML